MISLQTYLQERSAGIQKALDAYLPKADTYPPLIHEAMRYSVLGDGKRIRPVLTLAVNEMLGGGDGQAMIPACAIEFIHSYSLVHDDLPFMDNDDIRRGKPSCHKKYGEAVALLAGDALLTYAFQLLGTLEFSERSARLIREIAMAAGTTGMIGGQLLDIQSGKNRSNLEVLDDINRRKTGQLIKVSCLAGALVGGASPEQESRILRFGEYLGFAFQVVDDIIDGNGYLFFMNEQEARKKAEMLVDKAKDELSVFKTTGEKLRLIADSILERKC